MNALTSSWWALRLASNTTQGQDLRGRRSAGSESVLVYRPHESSALSHDLSCDLSLVPFESSSRTRISFEILHPSPSASSIATVHLRQTHTITSHIHIKAPLHKPQTWKTTVARSSTCKPASQPDPFSVRQRRTCARS